MLKDDMHEFICLSRRRYDMEGTGSKPPEDEFKRSLTELHCTQINPRYPYLKQVSTIGDITDTNTGRSKTS